MWQSQVALRAAVSFISPEALPFGALPKASDGPAPAGGTSARTAHGHRVPTPQPQNR